MFVLLVYYRAERAVPRHDVYFHGLFDARPKITQRDNSRHDLYAARDYDTSGQIGLKFIRIKKILKYNLFALKAIKGSPIDVDAFRIIMLVDS